MREELGPSRAVAALSSPDPWSLRPVFHPSHPSRLGHGRSLGTEDIHKGLSKKERGGPLRPPNPPNEQPLRGHADPPQTLPWSRGAVGWADAAVPAGWHESSGLG